jgi:glycosyltransferase involved in cell wall biosynthesis
VHRVADITQLSPDEFEVICIDDGSTDDTPEGLDELATTYPNIRVIYQPNSGWPGQPRNVGLDAK